MTKHVEVQTMPARHEYTRSLNSHFEEATPTTYQMQNSGLFESSNSATQRSSGQTFRTEVN